MDVYLIRHTRPDVDPEVCHGRLDVPPAADFPAGAQHVLAALPAATPLVTAAACRCRRLADHLAEALGSSVSVDDRLREMDFGRWEGRRWRDIPRAQTDAWSREFWSQPPPDGEAYASMHARVAAAWEAMLARSDEALAVVGPIGPLRALLTIALDLPPEAFVRVHLDHGGVTKLSDATGGWRLDYSNR